MNLYETQENAPASGACKTKSVRLSQTPGRRAESDERTDSLCAVLSALAPFLDKDGRLTAFPARHKKKLMALWYLAGKLEDRRQYTEAEINALLDEWTWFHDPATLRRELYHKRLLDRTADCSRYWKPEQLPALAAFMKQYV